MGKLLSRPQARVAAAVAFVFAHRLLGAWLLAAPFAAVIGGSGLLELHGGEALLFEPGGLLLLDVLLQRKPTLSALAGALTLPIVVWTLLGLGPLWVLLDALREHERPEPASQRAAAELPALVLLAGVTTLLRVFIVGVALASVLGLRGALDVPLDERRADLFALTPLLVAALLLALVAILQDLAQSAIVGRGAHVAAASVIALTCAAQRPLACALRWAVARALGAAAVGLGVLSVSAIDVAHTQAAGAALAFAIHQLSLLLALGTRSMWLAWAAKQV